MKNAIRKPDDIYLREVLAKDNSPISTECNLVMTPAKTGRAKPSG